MTVDAGRRGTWIHDDESYRNPRLREPCDSCTCRELGACHPVAIVAAYVGWRTSPSQACPLLPVVTPHLGHQ